MRRNGAAMPVLICNASDFCKIAAAKRLHVAKDLPGVPIPPFEVKQVRDQLIVKPPPDHAARIPARDAVWRNILCDDGIRADDRAVANVYGDFFILAFRRNNPLSQKAGATYGELIITNYDPRPYIQPQVSMFPAEIENGDLVLVHEPTCGSLREIDLARREKELGH